MDRKKLEQEVWMQSIRGDVDNVYERYIMELIIYQVANSYFAPNIICKSNIFYPHIIPSQRLKIDDLVLTFSGIALNKFNISRLLKNILEDVSEVTYEIKNIRLLNPGKHRSYMVSLNFKIERRIIPIVLKMNEGSGYFPLGKKTIYRGIFVPKLIVNIYEENELVADKFINALGGRILNMQDFYDLYLILTRFKPDRDKVNKLIKDILYLKDSIKDMGLMETELNDLQTSRTFKVKWHIFCVQKDIDEDITSVDLIGALKYLMKILKGDEVNV